MKSSKMRKIFAVLVAVCTMMIMSSTAFAATVDIFKDGAFAKTTAFINSADTAITDGVITGPGNWTQLNFGDATVDAEYLHVVVSATGDTSAAQVTISDTAAFRFADLGVTLTEEYQDVVLPLGDKNLAMLSWCNFQGLQGTDTWNIKEIFLSDDAASTTAAAEVAATDEAAPADDAADAAATDEAMPQTGSTNTAATLALIAMVGSGLGFVALKKFKKAF